MLPACLHWMSFDSTCPCTCSAGPSCAAMCHRKECSRLLAPITSTWPCCWLSSSCPPCRPSTPSSQSHRLLIADPSGNEMPVQVISRYNLIGHNHSPFSVARIVCLMWFKRHWSRTSLCGSVKRSATPLTLDWCYPSCCLWCESTAHYVNVYTLI